MRKDIRSSTSPKALAAPFPLPSWGDAMGEVFLSVDRFCLLAGIEPWAEMMEEGFFSLALGTAGGIPRLGRHPASLRRIRNPSAAPS